MRQQLDAEAHLRPPEMRSHPMSRTLHLPFSFPLALLWGAPTIGFHPCSSAWLRPRPPWQHSQARALPHRGRQAETGPRPEWAGSRVRDHEHFGPHEGVTLHRRSPRILHSNCCTRVPKRPHRGRFGTLLGPFVRQLANECCRLCPAGFVDAAWHCLLSATSEDLSFLCRGDHACMHS